MIVFIYLIILTLFRDNCTSLFVLLMAFYFFRSLRKTIFFFLEEQSRATEEPLGPYRQFF